MTTVTNTLVEEREERLKANTKALRLQHQLEKERTEKIIKNLKQELETCRLNLSMTEIQKNDLDGSLTQISQFLEIYKDKYNDAYQQLINL